MVKRDIPFVIYTTMKTNNLNINLLNTLCNVSVITMISNNTVGFVSKLYES
ncbi:MAG: hypothetical protein SLAVMIC_00660 [uncultured marine phage]|uniref:Uncharacterized protein n=1 Tax=uncultured marine phage TaxID=707152 RepID=A0A8D9FRQ9_9VIRU|nr:MAG: hypothetical protein SLAVMIC_00660 [uncultured marine phage]